MYDLIIRGGMIVDGTRAPAYQADVCIQNGRIAEITAQCGAEAKKVIDAAGKVVSPGFIDIHTHSDLAPLSPFDPESKTNQGVTFELTGNCGISPLPSTPETRAAITEYYLSNLQYPPMDITVNSPELEMTFFNLLIPPMAQSVAEAQMEQYSAYPSSKISRVIL